MKYNTIFVTCEITKLQSMTDIIEALKENEFEIFHIENNSSIHLKVNSLEELNSLLHLLTCFQFYNINVTI